MSTDTPKEQKDLEIERLQAIIDGFNEPSDKTISKICHAFWRRIYPFKDNFSAELPTPTPVEFVAHMGTALTWLKLDADSEDPRYDNKGYDDLWQYFGLSYSTWLTLPRVMMHEMPDIWQERMAALLHEWDNTWNTDHMPDPYVTARKNNKFTKWPSFLLNYRRPDNDAINKLRVPKQ